MGVADRDYMRDDERSWHWSASVVLMVVLTVVFIFQQGMVVSPARGVDADHFNLLDHLVLKPDDLQKGYLWELLTFQFLHASWGHLIGNLMGIWFIGLPLESRLGKASMLKIYFAGGLVGGVFQGLLGLAIPGVFGGSVVGASAGVMALFAVLAMMEPYAQFLLFFFLPVRAKQLLWGSLAVAIVCMLWFHNTGIAHAAHLGGLLTGMAFEHWRLYALGTSAAWRPLESRQRKRELVRAASVHASLWRQTPDPEAEVPPEEFISREVDPILDKISAHGLQSLTERERKILEAARKKMDKR